LKSKRLRLYWLKRGAEFLTLRTISVPSQIYEWKASPASRDRAREVSECNRKDFLQAFSDGLQCCYERDQHDRQVLLGRWEETGLSC